MVGIIIDGMEKNVNPKVSDDFNPAAFLNAMEVLNPADVVESLDKNKSFFEEKYHAPIFTDSQRDKLENNLGEFENWLINLVM